MISSFFKGKSNQAARIRKFIRINSRICHCDWMVVVIPVRFKEKDLRKIDELVKSGIFGSRSEAIRSLSLEEAEAKHADLITPSLYETVETILEALKADRNSLNITLDRKIEEYVAEGRERL